MYTVCLHYSLSEFRQQQHLHKYSHPHSDQEESSSKASTIIVHMATTTSSTSTTSSSASSGYGTATTINSSSSSATPPTTPPEHPSPELLDHLPPAGPILDSNLSMPSSTLNRHRSPSPSTHHLPRFVPSPSSSTRHTATVHHPNFANHVSEHHHRHLLRHHLKAPPPPSPPPPANHHNSYSSSGTGSSSASNNTTSNLYYTQTSVESSGSPPPYTDTMDSRQAGAAAAGLRGRLDSAAADSVESFKVGAPADKDEKDHVQNPRPSSSRDVYDNSAPSTSRFQPVQNQQQPEQTDQRKLGHRRVDENGEVTYKHIQSTQIMYSIQLGIGHSVGSLASKPERDVLYNDFNTVETVHFPVRGSTTTPAHHYADFDFTTFTPNAFRHFRDLFRIQPEDYMLSMTAVPLRELSNPGASGSVFYITDDDLFIVKTVEKTESKFLLKLLPGYYMNLSQNPHTLLPKFFGLYTYECSGKNIRILVMNNLLPSDVRLHEKYDLKGSTYKRKASEAERSKRSPTFKDLDFLERYHLLERYSRSTVTLHKGAKGREMDDLDQYSTIGSHYGHAHMQLSTMTLPNGTVNGVEHEETAFGGLQLEAPVYDELMNTLARDCRVLESFEIMDYSLLVGVHNYDRQLKEDKTAVNFDYDDDESLPAGAIRASNHKGERLLLFVGIIDILQSYRLFKKVEHAWKALLHDGDTVSVHRPKFYARRFMNFMQKYVFARVSPPGSSKNDDKYSLYYQVARQRKDSAWNNSASTLQRSISQHPTYASYGSHYR